MLEIPLATLDFCAQRFSPKVKILIIIFVYIFNTVNCLRFEFPFHISYLYCLLIFVYWFCNHHFCCAWCAFWDAIALNHWATKDVDNQFEFNKKQRRWLSADDDNQFGPNNIRSLVIGDDDND